MNKQSKSPTANILLVLFSVAIALGACEMFLRLQAHLNNTVDAQFSVYARDVLFSQYNVATTGTVYGRYKPSESFNRSIYNEQGELKQRNFVPINNMGWISRYDYQIEKASDEFRIIMIGDSFTGTATNTRIWSDTVQDLLNEDKGLLKALGKKRITVFNLGQGGAGFDYFYYPLSHTAYRLSPDLVVVNFITEDVFRRHPFPRHAFKDPRDMDDELARNQPAHEVPISRLMEFGDIKVPLTCWGNTSDPDCMPLDWWIPQGVEPDPDRVNTIKKAIAQELSWQRNMTSTSKSYLWDFVKQSSSQLAPAEVASAVAHHDVQRSAEKIKTMSSYLPNMLLAHIPTYADITRKHLKAVEDSLYESLKKVGFPAYTMAHWMPTHRSNEEVKTWYNLPHDGHWSDKGADLYAAAMHRLIRKQFLKRDTMVCGKAFDHYAKAVDLRRQEKQAEYLASLNTAMAALPKGVTAKYSKAPTYAECGFLPDLYLQHAQALLLDGDKSAAKISAKKAQQLQPDLVAIDALLVNIGMDRKDMKAAIVKMAKTASGISDTNVRVATLLEAARSATTHGFDEKAVDIYKVANQSMPNYLPIMMGLADTHINMGEYQEASGYLSAILLQQPNHEEAKTKLDKIKDSTSIEIKPIVVGEDISPKELKALVNELYKDAQKITDKGQKVRKMLRIAALAESKNMYHKAEDMYREILVILPNHLPALERLAGVLIALDKHQEAQGFLQAALAQAPDKPALVALMEQASGSNISQGTMFTADMSEVEVRAKMTQLQNQAGEIQDINLRVAKLLHIADIAEGRGLQDQAEHVYLQVLEMMPNHLPALKGLSYLYVEQGQPMRAMGYLNAAIAQDPDDEKLQDTHTVVKTMLK